MRAAAGQDHASNRCSAHQAWLPGAEIDPMLELEEACYSGGIHVVGYGRATERDGFPEDALQAGMQTVKFRPLQVASHPAGPDTGAEETLVGIDISHSMQELLIQQSSLDRGAAGPEKGGELVGRDTQGLLSGSLETVGLRLFLGDPVKRHASEAPGVHKAELSPRLQMQNGMGVRRKRRGRIGDQQATGHAQVHDPLQAR